LVAKAAGVHSPPLPNINYDEKFQKEMFRIIENSISQIWGKDVAYVIFYNFSEDNKRGKGEIVRDPALFEATLDKMFGTGSRVIKRKIIEEIAEEFHFPKTTTENLSIIDHAIRLAWKARNELMQ
jgi:hypothetical protein